MARMKELDEENRRLKKLYVEAQFKDDIITEALEKKSKAVSQAQGGQTGG